MQDSCGAHKTIVLEASPAVSHLLYRAVRLTDLFNADVMIERDVPYLGDEGEARHRLDIYARPGASGLPVVIFFHGGGWRSGDKRLFEHLGRALALRGIVTVIVNYRLTPQVRHPLHARDCAASVAWVVKSIALRGGDPERIFLTGHSSGAHLALLLTLDPRYLTQVGLPGRPIRGTVTLSGAVDLTLHVETTRYTTRGQIEEAFGSTLSELVDASPITYIHSDPPPILVIVAEGDPDGLKAQAKRFADLLREVGAVVVFLRIKGRDHFSIVRRFGPFDDTTAGAVADFINHFSVLRSGA